MASWKDTPYSTIARDQKMLRVFWHVQRIIDTNIEQRDLARRAASRARAQGSITAEEEAAAIPPLITGDQAYYMAVRQVRDEEQGLPTLELVLPAPSAAAPEPLPLTRYSSVFSKP